MSTSSRLRIVYAGTPDFAVSALRRLIHSDHAPCAVFTQPDRPAGRGRKLQASPVKQAAMDAAIDVYQPASLKQADAQAVLYDLKPDLFVVVAYGLILPPAVLQIPRFGCWNIHASLLPRWRGAAPIQRAIEAGDRQSGVCIMQMDEGLDTGAILACSSTDLAADETGGSLHDRLAELGAGVLMECIGQLAAGTLPVATRQPEEGVTYAAKLDKSEARLDWQQPARSLERKVRAFNPWPVAWCTVGDERIRIWQARAIEASPPQPAGTVISATATGIDIATAGGALRIERLQRPGGREISAAEFLNAVKLPDALESRE